MILPQPDQVNTEPDPYEVAAAYEALHIRAEMRRRCQRDDSHVTQAALRVGIPYAEIVAILAGDD